MLSKNIIHKATSLALTIAIFCVYSMVALAGTKEINGEITVTGQVTVDGQAIVSNSTIVSGSTVATAANSTAVVSLGKTGRLELLPESNLTLRFTDGSITGILSAGKVRVSNSAGVATTITTKDSVAIADAGQADTFVVEVECSHTHVDTMSGLVTLRSGSTDRQVAAGTDATAGNLSQTGCKPCMRPNPNPGVFPVAAGGWFAPLLIAAAGGAAAAVLLGSTGTEDITIGGTTTVVSGTR